MASTKEMSGLRKAAILTLMLGAEKSADAIARLELEEGDVERLAAEVARLKSVDAAARQAVADEFAKLAAAMGEGLEGMEAAHEILRHALGSKRADQVMARVRESRSTRPFAMLAHLEPGQLLELLRDEHPQAIAVVLGHLPRRRAGQVLSGLPEEMRMEVVMRLAKGGEAGGEAVREMESTLSRRAAALGTESGFSEEVEQATTSGPRALVETLNYADLSVETQVLEALAERDPELGEQVRDSMFIFEDLPRLDGRALQTVVRQVEPGDLALALKGASDEIKKVVFDNLSENAAAGLRDDLESLGPVRRRDVYEAQQKVVMRVRELAEDGKISVRQEGEEEEEDLIT
jgi:flagellar motor switch protein FliG